VRLITNTRKEKEGNKSTKEKKNNKSPNTHSLFLHWKKYKYNNNNITKKKQKYTFIINNG